MGDVVRYPSTCIYSGRIPVLLPQKTQSLPRGLEVAMSPPAESDHLWTAGPTTLAAAGICRLQAGLNNSLWCNKKLGSLEKIGGLWAGGYPLGYP